ncbi:polysaccharide biosynthesis protein [Legionella busanensis]|uniref:Polysaccharide biosynthesis protein n=1 Tax=Legionella busanensis TaxID=190655 RepID=A0A378JM19_9GAMM|nr:DegT/DnrJ/EryC1/StrS family aminotransferase [Legionella busanensis]STX52386.1 polysaccharide biosynthesis protein [Legionella busanensis]
MITMFNSVTNESLQNELVEVIQGVLTSGQYVLGSATKDFEKAFADYCNVNYCIGVNSGTSALHLALIAAGIQKDDEVITTPFTFIATSNAIDYVGAKPVFVDIDPISFTLNPSLIKQAITAKTKAIIPVHLFGQMADMDPIMDIAKEYKLIVIEDAAQANGAMYKGKRAGSIGDLGCFSCYPTKNLPTAGDAGMITTNNNQYNEKIRLLRSWGKNLSGDYDFMTFNYRISEIQAAILLCKLKYLEQWNMQRAIYAGHYIDTLSNKGYKLPRKLPYTNKHTYSLFTLASNKRTQIMEFLAEKGIQTSIYYPKPLHLQPMYNRLKYSLGDFPQAELAARNVFSIPIYPELSKQEHQFIINCLLEFYTMNCNKNL